MNTKEKIIQDLKHIIDILESNEEDPQNYIIALRTDKSTLCGWTNVSRYDIGGLTYALQQQYEEVMLQKQLIEAEADPE